MVNFSYDEFLDRLANQNMATLFGKALGEAFLNMYNDRRSETNRHETNVSRTYISITDVPKDRSVISLDTLYTLTKAGDNRAEGYSHTDYMHYLSMGGRGYDRFASYPLKICEFVIAGEANVTEQNKSLIYFYVSGKWTAPEVNQWSAWAYINKDEQIKDALNLFFGLDSLTGFDDVLAEILNIELE